MTVIDCEKSESRLVVPPMDDEPWQKRAKMAGLSQKTLALLLGVHVNTVSQQIRGKWESGMPRYVKAVIVAWERMPQKEREAYMSDAAKDFED